MSLVYVSIFIVSIAFAIVAIYLAKLLLKMSHVVTKLGHTTNQVETKLDKTIFELEEIISETELTAVDVQTKIQATNGLFLAIENLGETSKNVSDVVELKTQKYNEEGLQRGVKPFVRTIQFSEFGFGLLKSWNKGKKASS